MLQSPAAGGDTGTQTGLTLTGTSRARTDWEGRLSLLLSETLQSSNFDAFELNSLDLCHPVGEGGRSSTSEELNAKYERGPLVLWNMRQERATDFMSTPAMVSDEVWKLLA